MAILSCAVCVGEFEANSSRAKYCSRKCKDRGKPSANWKGRENKQALAHGLSGYRRGCRCAECRDGQRIAMREYTQRRKAADGIGPASQYKRSKRGVDPLAVVNCRACHEPLQNIRSNRGRYPLHKTCRQTAPEWMRRGLDNPRRAKFQAKIDKAAAGTSGGGRVFTSGPCSWCGTQFTGFSFHCSRKCSTSAKFAGRSKNAFKISPKERARIYGRDNETCQLCSHPVDLTLHYLHDWSATLDHIVPQSHMLIPDHSPSNLRLAHRWCNSARGDGSNMTEIQLHARIAEFKNLAA
jgi:hypothetical protein